MNVERRNVQKENQFYEYKNNSQVFVSPAWEGPQGRTYVGKYLSTLISFGNENFCAIFFIFSTISSYFILPSPFQYLSNPTGY